MRLHAFYLTGALIATAVPLSAGAVPVAADHQAAPALGKPRRLLYTCPRGYYWEPDAYARHGKFRPAHCALRW